MLDNFSYKVGNGQKIFFWKDNWIGSQALKKLFPDIFSLTQTPDATIQVVWEPQGWNVNLRRFLNDWEVNRTAEHFKVLEQFQGTTANEDKFFLEAAHKKNLHN